MSLAEIVLLLVAGGLAGAVNAIAGGGNFFTFAALTALGLPPVAANATGAVSMVPGQVASMLAYRRDLRSLGVRVVPLAVVSALGGLAGAWLLLHAGHRIFKALIPWLLLGATLLFAMSPFIAAWTARWRPHGGSARAGAGRAGFGALALQALVALYGGYFGAGLGIMMLAALSLTFDDDFHVANAMKNALAVLAQGFATALFLVSGIVRWPEAAVIVVAGIAGGWAGVRLAHLVPALVIRVGVILTGLGLALWFATR